MAHRFFCPRCGETVVVGFLAAGESARCPGCNSDVPVPEAAAETDEQPAPPPARPVVPRRLADMGPEPQACLRTVTDVTVHESLADAWLGDLYVLEQGLVCICTHHLPGSRPSGIEGEFMGASGLTRFRRNEYRDGIEQAALLREEQHGMSVEDRVRNRPRGSRLAVIPRRSIRRLRRPASGSPGLAVVYRAPVAPGARDGTFRLVLTHPDAAEFAEYLGRWLENPATG